MSITLTGCVDFISGEVSFDDAVCNWSGCLVTDGIHTGQVAITPGSLDCPDTYFGCVEFPDGTFSVIVPESCCPCTTDACCACWGCGGVGVNKTPTEMRITFSGIESCPAKSGASLNGDYILVLDESEESCDCAGDPLCLFEEEVSESHQISVSRNGTQEFTVVGKVWDGSSFKFAFLKIIGHGSALESCESFKGDTASSDLTEEGFQSCDGGFADGFGGTATWSTDTDGACDG